ncbi:hypothetical protein KQX54_012952 [Cotesia glomerata]|uniref:Homeobox domain-containing protein n=1 Tax=Cotesia glomerata TaxID=32391 RepID=A0AAV7ISB8_COTGL|nr:hypothetical protein KQX54_012952 [Cotesia glomerata]
MVKVWFQNRRMKHKRQTLSKEDGDEKDVLSSDGVENLTGDKTLTDEDEKKNCHKCDITGGANTLNEINDNGLSNSSKHSLSALNNRGASGSMTFSNNSNGASSIGSTNSVSSSFERLVAEDDSRSNDESAIASPKRTTKKTIEVKIKIEGDHKNFNSLQNQLLMSQESPRNTTEISSTANSRTRLTISDSTGVNSTASGQTSSTRSLTPSSTPGTPVSTQLPQGSPLGIQSNQNPYIQRPRSSPSSASYTSSTILNNLASTDHRTSQTSSNIPITLQMNTQTLHNTYQTVKTFEYQNRQTLSKQNFAISAYHDQSQNIYSKRDTYHQRTLLRNELHPLYPRQNHATSSLPNQNKKTNTTTKPIYNSSMQYHQQQTLYLHADDYNGYLQNGPNYHASYHRNIQGGNIYGVNQTYSNSHNEHTSDGYVSSNNYSYTTSEIYHNTEENINIHDHSGISLPTGHNYYDNVSVQQPHQESSTEIYAVHQPSILSNQSDDRYLSKYSNSYYAQNPPLQIHQGGEASNIPSNYVSSPDPFPTPGMTNAATAIAAATATVITPSENIGQLENNSESYANTGSFYVDPTHAAAPSPSGEISNNCSDFNFLSNLANDFVPEYYQLS